MKRSHRATVVGLILGNLIVYAFLAGLAAWNYGLPSNEHPGVASAQEIPNPSPEIVVESNPLPVATPTLVVRNVPSLPTTAPTIIALAPQPPPAPTSAPVAQPAVRDPYLVPPSTLNILLLGTDRRPNDANWRTDTIILASVDQEDKTVGLLSIPRDLWVTIPDHGQDRINAADFYGEYFRYPGGGPALLKQTLEDNLGLRVHYYVRVDFNGFRRMIDALGGIDVAIDCPLVEYGFSDDYGTVNLNFQPGVQHMDGVTALRYARSRYTTSDYDRARRQRRVLLAMWDKALRLDLLPQWPALWNEFKDSIQTDLGPVELAGLAWVGAQVRLDRVKTRAIDKGQIAGWITPAGAQVLIPQPEKIHAFLLEFFSGLSAPAPAWSQENARIAVYSGTGSKQIADVVSTNLRHQGFNVLGTSVAAQAYPRTMIVVYNAKPETVKEFAQMFNVPPERILNQPAPNVGIDVQVILGWDYNPCGK